MRYLHNSDWNDKIGNAEIGRMECRSWPGKARKHTSLDSPAIDSSLGFLINNYPTLRAKPKNEGGYCKS